MWCMQHAHIVPTQSHLTPFYLLVYTHAHQTQLVTRNAGVIAPRVVPIIIKRFENRLISPTTVPPIHGRVRPLRGTAPIRITRSIWRVVRHPNCGKARAACPVWCLLRARSLRMLAEPRARVRTPQVNCNPERDVHIHAHRRAPRYLLR